MTGEANHIAKRKFSMTHPITDDNNIAQDDLAEGENITYCDDKGILTFNKARQLHRNWDKVHDDLIQNIPGLLEMHNIVTIL